MTREEYITAAEISFEKLMSPTRGLRPELMEMPMSEGKWTFKELAGHLTFWDTVVVRALEALNQGQTFDWSVYADRDACNREILKSVKLQSLKRVMNELRVTHSTVTEALRRLPDDKLLVNGDVPDWLVREVPEHYAHHTSAVETWVRGVKAEY